MIRTTAEASSTNFAAVRSPISAGAILTNQFFWGGIKRHQVLLPGPSLKIGEGLTPTLARVTTADLLQITESLLAQTAVMLPGALLKQLMQRIWHIANLQRGHRLTVHALCMQFTPDRRAAAS
jgi:hypothetical protein